MAAKRMARDYKPKRKPAGRFPAWLGMLCGLGAGLIVAGVVYLKDHRPGPDAPITAPAKPGKRKLRNTESPEPDTPDSGTIESPAKAYDFYDKLPTFEVVVPEKEKDVKHDVAAVPETRRGTYVLQAGSYKTFPEADRVRAQLALRGVESKVQKVTVDNDTWLRIRIGPISKLDELNRLRTILRKADIDALVIRVGD